MPFEPINLFFACDEKYHALCGVAITSLKANCDRKRTYRVTVLHTDVSSAHQKKMVEDLSEEGFSVAFRNVSAEIAHFAHLLHTRDYYSRVTYFRLMIPTLFPQMDKALYLDSDIILQDDVSLLYDTPLGDCLVGAIPDGFVNHVPILRRYVENRVGVKKESPYFNAGVLLMNLHEMRKARFEDLFLSVLQAVTFCVAQDQDYLNVICRDRVVFLPMQWNYMPFQPADTPPSLIHFNLDSKPWQKEGVLYEACFWQYARGSVYEEDILRLRESFTEECVLEAARQTEQLIATATAQGDDTAENERIAKRIDDVLCLYMAKSN